MLKKSLYVACEQECAEWGGVGAWHPQFYQICKEVGQKAAILQESWQQYIL